MKKEYIKPQTEVWEGFGREMILSGSGGGNSFVDDDMGVGDDDRFSPGFDW